MMKKFLLIILSLILGLSVLSGCADPLKKDFEKFINVDMTEVNGNYEAIKKEASKWSELDDAAWITSLKDVLIPKCEETLKMLWEIESETEEVNNLKNKFFGVISSYKEGFEFLLEGIETLSEEKLEEGNVKLAEGAGMVEEYNKELEALAEKTGMKLE